MLLARIISLDDLPADEEDPPYFAHRLGLNYLRN